MSSETVLATRKLEVNYGAEKAVKGVSLEVGRGEVIGLIGPDGAGKTSTLRVLAGLLRASGGEALSFGRDSWAHRRTLHRRLGYLAQRFALYGDLSVDENVRFFALLYGVKGWRDRRTELLTRVGLQPFRDRLAERLSGGMKQKLALTCTLIHSPSVLLLDEPTTGVDPVTRREFWQLLADLVAEGLTLVVATPYLDEAERCTRVVLMHEGSVIADAPPDHIPARIPGQVVEITASPRAKAMEVLRTVPGIEDVTVFGSTLHARVYDTDDPTSLVRSHLLSGGVEVTLVEAVPTGLEDAFLYLTRERPLLEEAS